MGNPTFKPYYQDQLMAFPPNLDDLVPKTHTVRVVSDIINKINLDVLIDSYEDKGRASYHPAMLLKVVVYGYINNIYSSRKLESACKENVHFMWLSAMNFPDHNTINRFRGVKLKDTLRSIFDEVVILLSQEGLLSIKEVYTDGTKIEANANKYTFVWKKAIQTNKEKMKKQLESIWEYAQSVSDKEDSLPDPPDFTNIDSEKVKKAVDTLNKALSKAKNVAKKQRAKMNYITKNFPSNIEKYEQQEAILGERNSYSKTDKDATFMRMKEDHMLNGQLKPGYNVQISTSNQFIVNYTLHPNPTDTRTLQAHIEQHESSFGKVLESLTADAGYGSEENYDILETKNIKPFVKYNMFDKQQNTNFNKKTSLGSEKLHYDPDKDVLYCPMGQEMSFIGHAKRKTTSGYEQTLKKYQTKNCQSCPLNGACHKSKGNRVVEINHSLKKHKEKVHELLNSEEGIEKRKKRCYDVEPVFGNIKNNHKFKRFMLRGKEKVEIEWGLLSIAQNIRKKVA